MCRAIRIRRLEVDMEAWIVRFRQGVAQGSGIGLRASILLRLLAVVID